MQYLIYQNYNSNLFTCLRIYSLQLSLLESGYKQGPHFTLGLLCFSKSFNHEKFFYSLQSYSLFLLKKPSQLACRISNMLDWSVCFFVLVKLFHLFCSLLCLSKIGLMRLRSSYFGKKHVMGGAVCFITHIRRHICVGSALLVMLRLVSGCRWYQPKGLPCKVPHQPHLLIVVA